MNATIALASAWGPHQGSIQEELAKLARIPIPEEADFLWFVLMPFDLRGIPIVVWPTERNQQQHDGWEHENDLAASVPETVELHGLSDSPGKVDELRDACAEFLGLLWRAIDPAPERLAYFSINDDGWYVSLRDGRKISGWDLEVEIDRQILK